MSRDKFGRHIWPVGTRSTVANRIKMGERLRERKRVRLPPPEDRIILPPPDESDQLPGPPPAPVTEFRPPVTSLPDGPFDPKKPLPWDPYTYPETPSIELPPSYYVDRDRAEQLRAWLDKIAKGGKNRKKLRKPDDRQLPPGQAPPERQLPAFLLQAEVTDINEVFEEPEAWRLLGPNPLELYGEFLAEAGIRHFDPRELTKHRWRHTSQVLPGASAHSYVYDLFPPKIAPFGVHFLLAEYVVPPPEMWANILPALRILDRFREWLNRPVTGISGYRHPWYNSQIDGSSTSFHMRNAAIDFTYGVRFRGHLDFDLFLGFFDRLYRQRGDGTGRYDSNFIHLDVGHDRHTLSGKTERWVRPRDFRPPSRS